MSEVTYTDVVVIGAGPAGLMTALALSRLGVGVRIVDRRLPGEVAGQADGIQPRMTEIWDSFGIGEELRRVGTHVHKTVIYKPNENGTGITKGAETLNIAVSSTKYPFEVLAPINVIEGILLDALRKHGVVIEQPIVPFDLTLHDTCDDFPVEISLARLKKDYILSHDISQTDRNNLPDNLDAVETTQVLRAKYLVGCDGARSWVRKRMNILMEGDQTEPAWGVIDFMPVTDLPSCRAKNIIQSPTAGPMGYLPRPNGTARMYVLLKDTLPSDSLSTDEQRIVQAIESGFLPFKMKVIDVTWSSIYRVSQRVADRFSYENRVFIAGDACHTHSAKGGQGANASMTDACNLAWKLAYAVRGWAKPTLLSSYEDERRPYSEALIEFDKQIFKLFSPDSISSEDYEEIWRLNNMFTTGIGLRYCSTLIVSGSQELAPGLVIGERFPPGAVVRQCDWNPVDLQELMVYDGKFKLLLFPGDIGQPMVAQRFQESVKALVSDTIQDKLDVMEIIAVLNVPKEMDIHSVLCVLPVAHGKEDSTGEFYSEFGISSEQGVATLVRPDGHICMLIPLDSSAVVEAGQFLGSL
ncbi:FAD binding domain-containing protein [Hygrophoropsis aurantiaca]|uniref:FAD binding domain-containing protein n=1 Tax=Hygrophoropsis aurantiaca TaxID=72124 RepID=A0ACB8A930_9AGAM|nr:FAD binding domain-containing protein [Hygrophoropsis aurantiaca]